MRVQFPFDFLNATRSLSTLFTFPESLPHAIGWVTVLLLYFPSFNCLFLSTPRLRKILSPLKQKKNAITPLLGTCKLTNSDHKWPLSNHSLWWNERCNCLEGMNMGSMLAWGQRSSHAKVPFSLAQLLLYSIVWQLSSCTSATCQCSWYCVWCRQQSVTQQPAALHGAAFLR